MGLSEEREQGLAIANQLIEKEMQEKTGFLDLGCLALTELPDALFELEHLEVLNLDPQYGVGTNEFWTNENTNNELSNNKLTGLDNRLGQLKALKQLTICVAENIESIDVLADLKALTVLAISAPQSVNWHLLNHLSELHIENSFIDDLSFLITFKELKHLGICFLKVKDIGPLKNLSALTSLDCSNNQIVDINALKGLSSLTSLDFSGNQIVDIAPLQHLSALTSLNCYSNKIVDISSLEHLRALTSIDCSGNQIVDIAPLQHLSALTSLYCNDNQIVDIAPLQRLSALTSLSCNINQIVDIAPLQHLSALASLSCYVNQIVDIAPLQHLSALTSLNCNINQIVDISPLQHLSALASLSFNVNQIVDIAPLQHLSALTSLDCSGNKIVDTAPLQHLSALTSLRCIGNKIVDIAPLEHLSSLTSLNCSYNKIVDIAPLQHLNALIVLSCNGNQIVDIAPLQHLSALTTLDCSDNQIVDIAPLEHLNALTLLDCSGNQIVNIAPLQNLSELTTLNCSINRIVNIVPLQHLAGLRYLHCNDNSIEDVFCLAELSLTFLNLSKTLISEIPEKLLFSEALESLFLYICPFLTLPSEVVSKDKYDDCLEALRAHVRDMSAGEIPIAQHKLIVLGNGRAGKTQLIRQLRNLSFDETVPSTHGIEVHNLNLNHIKPELEGTLNLWDFGGQDIYHGTHALFAKSRAIFLVVWNPASEDQREYDHEGLSFRNNQLTYWLDYVKHLGSKNSPVIIVQSQCDKAAQAQAQLPTKINLNDFEFCIPCAVSAKTGRGQSTLLDNIADAVDFIEERQGISTIGLGRANVAKQLEEWRAIDQEQPVNERQYRTLSMYQFEQVCQQVEGVVHSPAMLLQYLHDTGAVFYNKEYFPDTIILDQSWALEAVYSLFDRDATFRFLTKLRGRFSQDILAELVWQDYSEKEQSLFIHLMQSCGICFQVKKAVPPLDISAEYIAPDLLPQRSAIEEELAQRRWHPDKHDFELRYRLPFLHFGVIRGLISAIGNLAVEAGIYWKDGVWVYEKQTNASAIISQQRDANSESSGVIVVQVQGPGSEALARKLAAWIRHQTNLRDQTPTILRAGEELPESEIKDYLSPGKHTSLIKSEHRKKGASEIDAEEKSAEQPVELHFAENISASPEKTEVFISYAWGVQEDLIDDLCRQLNHQDIEIIRDKTHLNSGDRISKFMQRLAMGHYIILVISQKYVQSAYCMNELYSIYRHCGADADKFINKVIPLITSDACIDSLPNRFKVGLYWKRQHEELIPLIEELGVDNIGEDTLKEYKNIGDFAKHVTEILSLVKDKLVSRDFEKASQDGFAEIVSLINKT